MQLLSKAKFLAEQIPEPMGKALSRVPYSWRLGSDYWRKRQQINRFMVMDQEQQKAWITGKTKNIVEWARFAHPFYKSFYEQKNFHQTIRSFDDIKSLPIVTKSDLQAVSINERTVFEKGAYLTNTGGTSGQPLVFYLDSKAFAREWAHMHFIWEKLDYQTKDLKLTLRGKNLGDRPLVYNPVHNEYMVNAYVPYDLVAEALWEKMKKHNIRFIHGFPSAIFDFITYCRVHQSVIIEKLKRSLKGILYGSEYPAPIYREPVEECLGVESISWYGHSEFAILAYEVEKYVYAPLHTYGFAEAIPSVDGHRLVCTGYYNRVCPFIRYDTGDLIKPLEQDEILRTFQISEGRTGDFITDANGKRISLTAFIFGRHHPIFNRVKFVQIAQRNTGEAVIILTKTENDALSKEEAIQLMDLNDINVTFDFLITEQPIRTKTGKVNLKVNFNQLSQFSDTN